MIRLEFLLEEPSMENVLKKILPLILPQDYRYNSNYFLRPHQGKSDLQKSIPNKMKRFSHFHEPVMLIILHDQDSNDCIRLKKELTELCKKHGQCPFFIRIVCRELESWFLGDMDAIEAAFPSFKAHKYKNKAKYRNPDLLNASDEMSKLLPRFQKLNASVNISRHLKLEQNTSTSFKNFVSGLKKILTLYNT
ncbi:MAG: DUF4276 family protein [Candidatus Aminicenantes bacterium]|nr:DUF4276 family protein [Candidatus Aminicenantes bacterium]